ncbi:MAG: hypothetical protein ACKVXR_10505 [Planctomycetota bacterium]
MENQAMTLQPLGWVFLIVSVGFVTGLVVWCYRRVLTLPPETSERAD